MPACLPQAPRRAAARQPASQPVSQPSIQLVRPACLPVCLPACLPASQPADRDPLVRAADAQCFLLLAELVSPHCRTRNLSGGKQKRGQTLDSRTPRRTFRPADGRKERTNLLLKYPIDPAGRPAERASERATDRPTDGQGGCAVACLLALCCVVSCRVVCVDRRAT